MCVCLFINRLLWDACTAIMDVSTDKEWMHGTRMVISVRRSITAVELVKVACAKFDVHDHNFYSNQLWTLRYPDYTAVETLPESSEHGYQMPAHRHGYLPWTQLTACTVYVNVCLQSVSDTAAITTWWQRCTVIQVNTAFCVTSYLELWHGITSPTNGGQHASTNARLFLKHHRQAIQHKYKINALVIRASKQCSDYRRVYNCCNVWWNWNKQSSLSVSSQVTTAAKYLLYCH